MTRYSKDVQKLLNRRSAMGAKDGAIIDPVVDEVNEIQWFFQYRKNSLNKYKWFAIGKQEPLWARSVIALPITPINTVVFGSQVVVPFDGLYWPRLSGSFGATTNALTWTLGVYLDATTLQDITIAGSLASGFFGNFDFELQQPIDVAAQHALTLGMQINILAVSLASNGLKVSPVAVNL